MKRQVAARARGPGRLYRETRYGETAWWLDFTGADGKRKRRKLSADRKLAERQRNELIRRRDHESAGLGVIGGQERLLSELRDLYLADLKIRSGAGHLANKGARLHKALAALRAQRVRDLTPADAIALQGALVRDGLGNTTINMRLGALQGMLRWSVRMRLIAESPIEQVQPLPSNEKTLRRRRRALSEDEIQRLIAAAEAEDRQSEQGSLRAVPQAPYFLTALSTGLRYGELRLLAWGAIDFDNAMLHVRGEHAKSGKSRAIPLSSELLHALAELLRFHGRFLAREVVAADRVFLAPRGAPWLVCSNNANRVLLRLLEAAQIPRFDEAGRKIDIHGLRHSFCTRLARSGASLLHAQILMGHADSRLTSKTYQHLESEATRGAIDALPPTTGHAPAPALRLVQSPEEQQSSPTTITSRTEVKARRTTN